MLESFAVWSWHAVGSGLIWLIGAHLCAGIVTVLGWTLVGVLLLGFLILLGGGNPL